MGTKKIRVVKSKITDWYTENEIHVVIEYCHDSYYWKAVKFEKDNFGLLRKQDCKILEEGEFSLNNLKRGMWIRTRNGEFTLIDEDNYFYYIDNYSDNLKSKSWGDDNIVRVYEQDEHENLMVIWSNQQT